MAHRQEISYCPTTKKTFPNVFLYFFQRNWPLEKASLVFLLILQLTTFCLYLSQSTLPTFAFQFRTLISVSPSFYTSFNFFSLLFCPFFLGSCHFLYSRSHIIFSVDFDTLISLHLFHYVFTIQVINLFSRFLSPLSLLNFNHSSVIPSPVSHF